MMDQKVLKGIVMALIGGSFWGLSGTCGQYLFAHSDMSATTATVIRMVCGGLILSVIAARKAPADIKDLATKPGNLIRWIIFSIGGLLLIQLSYLQAIAYTNAGVATFFQYSGLILVMLLDCLMKRRLPSLREVIAAVLVLGGVVGIATHFNLSSLAITGPALAWCLISAVALATYTVLPVSLLQTHHSLAVLGPAMCLGGVVLGVITRVWQVNFALSWDALLALGGVVILGTALGFAMYLTSIALCGPVKASMAACVELVAATLSSAFFLHTSFPAIDVIGFVLIATGVVMVSLKSEQQA